MCWEREAAIRVLNPPSVRYRPHYEPRIPAVIIGSSQNFTSQPRDYCIRRAERIAAREKHCEFLGEAQMADACFLSNMVKIPDIRTKTLPRKALPEEFSRHADHTHIF